MDSNDTYAVGAEKHVNCDLVAVTRELNVSNALA
jgi:hypothetical protein